MRHVSKPPSWQVQNGPLRHDLQRDIAEAPRGGDSVTRIRLISSAATVGAWTFLSRILGFVRDILIAAWLGSGPVAEAFLVAFSLPNMFRRFFAEGAFNMAFVPMFAKKLEIGEDAGGFARNALSGLTLILIVIAVLGTVFMPWLVLAMASGFASDMRFDSAVTLGRIVFVYIVFISLAALLSGVLNAGGKFAAAAAAPVLLNVFLVGMLILAELGFGRSIIGEAESARHGTLLAYGVVLAGIAQLALVWLAARAAGFDLRPGWPRWTPDLKRLAVIAMPAMLAGGVVQINLLIGRQVASYFDGAIVWLSFADRLYQLPLGVVGIAIGIVLLPDLSRRLAADDTDGGQFAFSRAVEMSLALAIPAAAALAVIPAAIVRTLFEHGAFGPADTAATALATAVYALGLPAFVLQKALQPLYFARQDTGRPFRFASAAMLINATLAIGLAPFIGYIAAAIGTTIAAWFMLALLHLGSRKMGRAAQLDAQARRRLPRTLLATAVMAIGLWFVDPLLTPVAATGEPAAIASLALLCVFGLLLYGVAGTVLGAFSVSELRNAMRR